MLRLFFIYFLCRTQVNLDKRDPAELLGVLLKTAEIDPNDMKWQIWKELGQDILNNRNK